MQVAFMTEATRDDILTEATSIRDIPELSLVSVRPPLPQVTRDHRDALYYRITHTTINPNKIVKCVYNARLEEFELPFLYHDEERDFDRIDWQTSVPYSDADLAKWSAAVRTTRTTTTPADNSARGRRHGPATRNRWLSNNDDNDIASATQNVKCHLKAFFANARSIRNKTTAIELWFTSDTHDIILCVET